MAKKKKRKKKKGGNIPLLQQIDSTINNSHSSIMEEIHMFQLELMDADLKAKKKAKKKGRKNPNLYNFDKLRKEAREKVVKEMEGDNFLLRIYNVLNEITPIIIIIARLVASLILSILSFTSVKLNIKPETLKKLNMVYQKAMAIK